MSKDHEILGIPENACILPWKHVTITTSGKIHPCCRFNEIAFKNSQDHDIEIPSIEDGLAAGFLNSNFYSKIRQYMLGNQRLDICKKCWISEEVTTNNSSMRTHWNNEYAGKILNQSLKKQEVLDINLEYLEIAFSSKCNLACRMCIPELSSKWAAIEKHYGIDNQDLKTYQLDVKKFDMDLSRLTKIKIVGGEPLLAKEHEQFIEKLLQNHKNLSNLEITYHTNGTILPNKKVLEFWKKIKKVVLVVSIDGVGDRNNYLRPGKIKWDTIAFNISYFKNLSHQDNINLDVSTHSVISRLNILRLHELNDWLLSQGMPINSSSTHSLDILSWPPEMSLYGLSNHNKQNILLYINDFLEKSNNIVFEESMERLIGVLKKETSTEDIIELSKVEEKMKMLDDYFGVKFSDLEDVV